VNITGQCNSQSNLVELLKKVGGKKSLTRAESEHRRVEKWSRTDGFGRGIRASTIITASDVGERKDDLEHRGELIEI